MRVIAGTARSLQLKTVEGLDTRPTTDRIKETLFNMLNSDVCECSFLDLFAGSGGIGIEALSRGANSCTFVEMSAGAIACIKENLEHTRLIDKARVVKAEAVNFVSGLKEVDCDIIFMDPPYSKGLERQALTAMSQKNFVKDTLIIVEATLDEDLSYVDELGFYIIKEKKYKTNKHVFVGRRN